MCSWKAVIPQNPEKLLSGIDVTNKSLLVKAYGPFRLDLMRGCIRVPAGAFAAWARAAWPDSETRGDDRAAVSASFSLGEAGPEPGSSMPGSTALQ